MNILFKLLLIVGVSSCLVSTALAIEYFDINKPGIEKLNLSIKASNSSDLAVLLVDKLRIQMRNTLLFNVLEDSEKATFILEISPTTDDNIISAKLTGAKESVPQSTVKINFTPKSINFEKPFSL